MGCGSKRPSGGGAQHLRQVRFRQEEQERKEEMLRDKQSVLEHGRHPYGVQPMGNMYASATPSIRPGLGLFGLLGDQAVMDLLEMLEAQQLGLLTCCSRVLYVFCHHDEVWRSLVLRLFGGQFEFKRSWKDTLGYAVRKAQYVPHLPREVFTSQRNCVCLPAIAHTHTSTHTRKHAHMRTRTHTCAHARTHTHTYAHSRPHASPPTRTHARTHARMHAHTHTRTHACANARTHARTHTCPHARTHACTLPPTHLRAHNYTRK